MINKNEAIARLLKVAKTGKTELIGIKDCLNRVLAKDLFAKTDNPPFDASAMDGYAIQINDNQIGRKLKVVGEVAAGSKSNKKVTAGEAVRIFTGAQLPKGADWIIIQEDVKIEGSFIKLGSKIEKTNFIRKRGSDFSIKDKLPKSTLLTPQILSLIAAMNHKKIPVYVKPTVAVISSGNELSEPGKKLKVNQVVASNNYGLSAMLESFGASPEIFPLVPDDINSICKTLNEALSFDLVVTVGGASVGKYDLIRAAGKKLGLKVLFNSIAMRPGKPLMGGQIKETPLIALPGNPVSALICCEVVVQQVIRKMIGLKETYEKKYFAILQRPLSKNGVREHYMRATTKYKSGQIIIKAHDRQDSHLLRNLADSNALLIRPPHDRDRYKGELVPFIRILNYSD